jgi:hypothetical protein
MPSLRRRILSKLEELQTELTLQQLYKLFPDITETTLRGRVYESLGKGICRVGKGLYISSKAIVQHGNSLEIINHLVESGDTFDTIFLDIPYMAAGQKGGNRNLSKFDYITPEQFQTFITQAVKLLKTDNSALLFMFTTGKTSKRTHDLYLSKIPLRMHKFIGTYQKMWNTGNPMNMGKYLMPIENIYVFSKSGNIDFKILPSDIQFKEVPDLKEYPTSKPYTMIKKLITLYSKVGDWVLDPFGGSGKTLQACLETNRYCHTIDVSDNSFNNHLITKLCQTQISQD